MSARQACFLTLAAVALSSPARAEPRNPCNVGELPDACLARVVRESPQLKQLQDELVKIRKQTDDARKKAQAAGSQAAGAVPPELVTLHLCLEAAARKKSGFLRDDVSALVRDPDKAMRSVLARVVALERQALKEAARSIPQPSTFQFAASPKGTRVEFKLQPGRFDAAGHLKRLLGGLRRIATQDEAAACMVPLLAQKAAMLQAEAPRIQAAIDKFAQDVIEPIGVQVAAAVLEKVVGALGSALSDPDAVHAMKGIVSEALLDPNRVKALAGRIGELNGALIKTKGEAAASSGAALTLLHEPWQPKSKDLLLLAAPAVKAVAKLVAHTLVQKNVPGIYDDIATHVFTLQAVVFGFIMEELYSLGDVEFEWGGSAMAKIYNLMWDVTKEGTEPPLLKGTLLVMNLAIDFAVDTAVDAVAAQVTRRTAQPLDASIRKIIDRTPDRGARLNTVINDVMLNLSNGYVKEMVTSLEAYNRNVATLVEHAKRLRDASP